MNTKRNTKIAELESRIKTIKGCLERLCAAELRGIRDEKNDKQRIDWSSEMKQLEKKQEDIRCGLCDEEIKQEYNTAPKKEKKRQPMNQPRKEAVQQTKLFTKPTNGFFRTDLEGFVSIKVQTPKSTDTKCSAPRCKFYETRGWCKYGNECRFSHDFKPTIRKTRMCRVFEMRKRCKYGKDCKFAHSREELYVPPQPVAEVKQEEVPEAELELNFFPQLCETEAEAIWDYEEKEEEEKEEEEEEKVWVWEEPKTDLCKIEDEDLGALESAIKNGYVNFLFV